MQIGGREVEGECPNLTCDIPDPTLPAWKLKVDSDGCSRWAIPTGAFACGPPPTPPIEAGPPCAPQSVAQYVASSLVPPKSDASACTSQELADFYAACITAGTSAASCAAFQAVDAGTAACGACLLSKTTDDTWGPVVVSATQTKMNVAGCVAIVQNDASASSCASRVAAELGCEAYACDAVCPVTLDAGATSYATCTQEVAAGDCRPYLNAECDPADAGVSQCFGDQTASATAFASFAALFCGGS